MHPMSESKNAEQKTKLLVMAEENPQNLQFALAAPFNLTRKGVSIANCAFARICTNATVIGNVGMLSPKRLSDHSRFVKQHEQRLWPLARSGRNPQCLALVHWLSNKNIFPSILHIVNTMTPAEKTDTYPGDP